MLPQVRNINLPNNTETSVVFPVGFGKVTFQARGAVALQYAWVTGEAEAEKFMTLKSGQIWSESFQTTDDAKTLYIFHAIGSDQILELETLIQS